MIRNSPRRFIARALPSNPAAWKEGPGATARSRVHQDPHRISVGPAVGQAGVSPHQGSVTTTSAPGPRVERMLCRRATPSAIHSVSPDRQ
jgi:hypothetical protein